MPKPDLKDIEDVKQKRVQVFQELRKAQQQALSTYEMKDKIGIISPYSILRTPRARNLIDVPVDHIIADLPVVKVKPRGTANKYKEEADLHEKFLQGLALMIKSMIRKQGKNLFLFGHFFWQCMVDYDKLKKLEDEPDSKDEEAHLRWQANMFDIFPIVIKAPVPTTI